MSRRQRKKLIIILVILLLLCVICFSSVIYLKKQNRENDNVSKPSNNGSVVKPNNNEEDPVLVAIKNEQYYLERNLSRYLSYAKSNPSKSAKDIVADVNAHIDSAFYTDVVDTNLDDGLLVLVNKYHKLPDDYEPDLVEMSNIYSYDGYKMNATAYEHLKDMIDTASQDGIKLFNISSYRSFKTQENLYNRYVNKDGKEAADTYSARAGYSEHQTGLATDLNTADENKHFENTKEYAWLKANAYKYGFIERYPQGKEYITGYIFEPWHYRYVGEEVAKYIYENDITFDEYYAFFIEK